MGRNETKIIGRCETRREFLKKTAAATTLAAGASAFTTAVRAGAGGLDVAIVAEPDDPTVKESPVQWAIGQLREALRERGASVQIEPGPEAVAFAKECILVSSGRAPVVRQILQDAGVALAEAPEALALAHGKSTAKGPQSSRRKVLLASGADVRGVVYAVLDLADRVHCAGDPMAELRRIEPVSQRPANRVRSVARLFASEVEDKAWFNDRAFWGRYLTELATHRFNRFSLTLGLGYDFPTDIRDSYFHFAYPFLIAAPGFAVRATPLSDAERDGNLETLRYISEETVRRGLSFQLGLWTHAYKWVDSPNANYVIEGLTPESHAAYCLEALAALLRACPAVSGVTFRIHGESGIAEGSYDFWRTVFEGVVRCGRVVEIDMHAKGMDDRMIELALATGMPVTISPKFWAEHAGLGYMQGAIRPQEMPPRDESDTGFFAKSSGSRRFLRYGYGDLLREDRRYAVVHRIWPGTQRLLLCGNPELAADYGRAASFCGSAGLEWCEPLSFKGRKGSGLSGGREAYADSSLLSAGRDFEKYRYSYRVWGRRTYDPGCAAEEWRRWLRKEFKGGALEVETAVAAGSRILPLVTTAHCPSAANNNYWPEMYTNMAIVDAKRPHPYGDTLSPKRFGTVSPLDPEFFARVDDFAEQLAHGESGTKYSPAWVAALLEAEGAAADRALTEARTKVDDPRRAEFRRVAADVTVEIGLGRFFAWKFRAAILFALFERSGSRLALERAVEAYRRARVAWAQMAEGAKSVYRSDVTFGPGKFQRGHWLDRLPAIDVDIADMEKLLNGSVSAKPAGAAASPNAINKAIKAVLDASPERRPPVTGNFHIPRAKFRRGEALVIEASLAPGKAASKLKSVHLRYRRVNQAELWQGKEMDWDRMAYQATIPAAYADSPFPLQYYFEVRERSGEAGVWPGLRPGWKGQPYFVVRQG
jgi:hypothetical protein